MIASLTGRADEYELVFSKDQDGEWAAAVPPDMSDGQYMVTLCAVTRAGESAVYRGVFYLSGGICRLDLVRGRFQISLLPPLAKLALLPEQVSIQMRRCYTRGTGIFSRRRKMA